MWAKKKFGQGITMLFITAMSLFPHISGAADLFNYEISPEDAPKFKKPIGIYSDGETNLFTGRFHTSYELPVPPARGNLVPKVSLEYSSTGETSIIGRGWSIPTDHIRRTLRHGVPRYRGPTGNSSDDEFEFLIEGRSGTLVFEKKTTHKLLLYRARREGIFAKFYYDPTDGLWRVLHPSGKVWIMGVSDAKDAEGSEVFAWYVKLISDPDGNQIRYSYQKHKGVLRLQEITYDQSGGTQISHRPYVRFDWKNNPSPQQISYKKSYRSIYDDKVLEAVSVGYEELDEITGAVKVAYPERRFRLIYGPEAKGSFHHNVRSFAPPDLPQTDFTYNTPITDFKETESILQSHTVSDWAHNLSVTRVKRAADGGDVQMRITSMLVDFDGDGDLDLFYIDSSKEDPRIKKTVSGAHTNYWFWVENLDGKSWGPKPKSIPIPSGLRLPDFCDGDPARCPSIVLPGDPSSLRFELQNGSDETVRKQDVLDINGDGKADLVMVSDADGKLYVFLGTGSGFKEVAQDWSAPPLISLLKLGRTWRTNLRSWEDAGLIDMNGDGLLDYVISLTVTPPRLDVHLNSGNGFSISPDYSVPIVCGNPPLIPASAIRASTYDPAGDALVRDLRDMNGDGIPDLVQDLGAGLQIYYGHGNSKGFDCSNVVTFSKGQISFSKTDVGYSHLKKTVVGLYDINGDGLIDILGRVNHAYKVYLNTGDSFTPLQAWDIGPFNTALDPTKYSHDWPPNLVTVVKDEAKGYYEDSDSDEYIGVKQMLLDIDGDGQVEFLTVPYSYSTMDPSYYFTKFMKVYGRWEIEVPGMFYEPDTPGVALALGNPPQGFDHWWTREWFVLGAQARPVHKLSEVRSGIGVATKLAYGFPYTRQSSTPFPVWTVTTVNRHDAATDDHRTTYIESWNPLYDPVRKEFRGFSSVKENQGDLRVIFHEFLQGEYDQGAEKLTMIKEIKPADLGNMLKVTGRKDKTIDLGNGRKYVYFESIKSVTYNPKEHSPVESLVEYVNDPKHGVSKEIRYYECDQNHLATVLDRIDNFDYAIKDTQERYIVRKKRQTRTNRHGNKATEIEWYFDDQCTSPGTPLKIGRPCSECVWRGTSVPPAVTRFEYDDLGRLTEKVDPDGVFVKFAYHGHTPNLKSMRNPLGHKIFFDDYDVFSGQASHTCGPQSDAHGNLRCDESTYDLYGRPKKIRKAIDSISGGYKTVTVTRFDYRDAGSLLSPPYVLGTYYPKGLQEESPGRMVKLYYDGSGRIIKHASSYGSGWSARYFAYDWFGNLSKAWLPLFESYETGFARPPLKSAEYSYYYDLLSRPYRSDGPDGLELSLRYLAGEVFVSDARNNTTRYTLSSFDEIKNIEQTVRSQTVRSSFIYDAAGRLNAATGPDGMDYTYGYYGDGTLQVASFAGAGWLYERTAAGRLNVLKTGGSRVEHKYDKAGRLEERSVIPGSGVCTSTEEYLERFFYDSNSKLIGRLTGVQGKDYKYEMSYDALGNMTFKKLTDLKSLQSLSYEKGFNSLGELETIKYPSGRAITFEYNNAGYLSHVSDNGAGSLSATFGYYVDGKIEFITGQVYPSLSWDRRFVYDAKRRLKTIDSNISGISWTIDYAYDKSDNVRSMKDNLRNLDYLWFYDEANRLKEAHGYWTDPYEYTYNKNGSLATVEEKGETFVYIYSDHHNHVLKSISSPTRLREFTADPGTGCRCSSVSDGKGINYSWTGDGLLSDVDYAGDPNSFLAQHQYDHEKVRWKRLYGGLTTLFLDDLMEYEESTGTLFEYLELPGSKCRLSGGQPGKCYFQDKMSVAAVFDDKGKLLHTLSYEPYGELINLTGTGPVAFDFNGKRREPSGGLLYYGARYYDSVSRQFISPDPLRMQGIFDAVLEGNTLQPYVYTGGNPITYSDPSGLQAKVRNNLAAYAGPSGVVKGGKAFWQVWREMVHKPGAFLEFNSAVKKTTEYYGKRGYQLLAVWEQQAGRETIRPWEIWRDPSHKHAVMWMGPANKASNEPVQTQTQTEPTEIAEAINVGTLGPLEDVGFAVLKPGGIIEAYPEEGGGPFTFYPTKSGKYYLTDPTGKEYVYPGWMGLEVPTREEFEIDSDKIEWVPLR